MMKPRILNLGFLLFVASCGPPYQEANDLSPATAEPLEALRVTYKAYRDNYSGPDAHGYKIRIENAEPSAVGPCRVVLNDSYVAALENVLVGGPGLSGPKPHGGKSIPPSSAFIFDINHDVSNHLVFRDENGRPFPLGDAIRTIRIDCADQFRGWSLQED